MKKNKIYNECCLSTMARIPHESIDMVITSPPYDNLRDYHGYSFPFEKIAIELYKVLKPGGVIIWVVGDASIEGSETGTSFKQALFFKSVGFRIHDTMIYAKVNVKPQNNKRYEQEFEYMFAFSKGTPNTFNPVKVKGNCKSNKRYANIRQVDGTFKKRLIVHKEMKVVGNIFYYACGFGCTTSDKDAFKHPAMFPENLARDQILTWTNEDDLVYDPFMGSGTTAKVCVALNRHWIGSEISGEYVDIANERIKKYDTNLFKNG